MTVFSILETTEQYGVQIIDEKAYITPINQLTQYHPNTRDNEYVGTYRECIIYITQKGDFDVFGEDVYSKSSKSKLAFAETSKKGPLHITSSNRQLLLCGLKKQFKTSSSELTSSTLKMFDGDKDLCDACRIVAKDIFEKRALNKIPSYIKDLLENVKATTLNELSADYFIKNTEIFSNSFYSMLTKINEDININTIKDLTANDNEAIFMLFKHFKLIHGIENQTLEHFNQSHCHYLKNLNAAISIN